MGSMAISANRSLVGSRGNRLPVHALLIREKRLGTVPAGRHYEFLPMTATTGGRNISVIDARFGITAWQQVERAAVAIDAGRGLAVARPDGLGMIAALVSGLLLGMALGTSNPARPDFMGRGFDVGMTIDAGKHAPVD